MEFPQGIVGAALATVILPALSRSHAAADAARYSATLDWGLRIALLVALPATIGLIVLAEPLNATLYQYGRFTAFDTRMAGLSLIALALGLPGFMLAKVLAPAFFSRQDTRTPVRAALVTVAANVALCAAIVTPLWWFEIEGAHAGIALATALAGTLNAWLLWRYLRRDGRVTWQPGWGRFGLRVGIACLAMLAAVLAARRFVGVWGELPTLMRVLHLVWVVGLGVVVYAGALAALGFRPRDLRGPA
jgi:putative peptidoglycan lipid II flippase